MSNNRGKVFPKPTHQRPRCETQLRRYLDDNGISVYAFARLIKKPVSHTRYWVDGQQLPSLIDAFRIEEVTEGKVPVASWLGTEIGKFLWNNRVTDHG